MVLDSFNNLNKTNLDGVVFAFCYADYEDGMIKPFKDINNFLTFMKERKLAIMSLWNSLCDDNHCIIEIEMSDVDFVPVYIDINDFQFIMPPIMLLPPYTNDSIERIYGDIKSGRPNMSEFPSGIMQAHLAYIKASEVINEYEMCSI